MTDVLKKIGQRVRSIRKEKGWSQEKLALEAGLDRTYINSLENGKRNISINNMEKIAVALHVTLADFFDDRLFEDHDWQALAGVPDGDGHKPLVMIIDDEPMISMLIKDMVGSTYRVEMADSVDGALPYLREHRFDVILLDYHLPPSNGLEALKKYPAEFSKSSVILMTGSGTYQIATEAMALGVTSLLSKPFEPQHLQRALKRAAFLRPRRPS